MDQRVEGENQRPPPLPLQHGAHVLGASVPRETQGGFDEEAGPRVGAASVVVAAGSFFPLRGSLQSKA